MVAGGGNVMEQVPGQGPPERAVPVFTAGLFTPRCLETPPSMLGARAEGGGLTAQDVAVSPPLAGAGEPSPEPPLLWPEAVSPSAPGDARPPSRITLSPVSVCLDRLSRARVQSPS